MGWAAGKRKKRRTHAKETELDQLDPSKRPPKSFVFTNGEVPREARRFGEAPSPPTLNETIVCAVDDLKQVMEPNTASNLKVPPAAHRGFTVVCADSLEERPQRLCASCGSSGCHTSAPRGLWDSWKSQPPDHKASSRPHAQFPVRSSASLLCDSHWFAG